MYLVVVHMRKKRTLEWTSRTLEIREENPQRSKAAARASARADYGSTHEHFRVVSCQRDVKARAR